MGVTHYNLGSIAWHPKNPHIQKALPKRQAKRREETKRKERISMFVSETREILDDRQHDTRIMIISVFWHKKDRWYKWT